MQESGVPRSAGDKETRELGVGTQDEWVKAALLTFLQPVFRSIAALRIHLSIYRALMDGPAVGADGWALRGVLGSRMRCLSAASQRSARGNGRMVALTVVDGFRGALAESSVDALMDTCASPCRVSFRIGREYS